MRRFQAGNPHLSPIRVVIAAETGDEVATGGAPLTSKVPCDWAGTSAGSAFVTGTHVRRFGSSECE